VLASVGVQRVDLGEGGLEYNRRLGCQMAEEGTVHVYPPTVRRLVEPVFWNDADRPDGRPARAVVAKVKSA
jgi:hypothetical protein